MSDPPARPPRSPQGDVGGSNDPMTDFEAALARLDADLARLAQVELEKQPTGGGARRRPAPAGPDTELASSVLGENCRALLEVLRKHCPDVLPGTDLDPGTVAKPVPLPPKQAGALLVDALRQSAATTATGRLPLPGAPLPDSVLWQDGADALLVDLVHSQVQLGDGQVTVVIPVRCDQLVRGVGQVRVLFAVGSPRRPAGMLAAASTHPEGPPVVVDRWGEPLTALAWQALLDLARAVAVHAGRDTDGAGLVPVALAASPDGLVVLPQARHPIDRVVAS